MCMLLTGIESVGKKGSVYTKLQTNTSFLSHVFPTIYGGLPELPCGHDGDVVSQDVCLLHGVSGHDCHSALLLAEDEVPDVPPDPGVHPRGWLICSSGRERGREMSSM